MNIKRLREIARTKGVSAGDMKRPDLIKAIQRAECYTDCYGASRGSACPEMNCLWREDCLKASAKETVQ